MKIALICDSLLLNRSLEMYLKDYLTSHKLCDFIVTTQHTESQKPVFLIGNFDGAHLKIPFTRELLFQALESFYASLKDENNAKEHLDNKDKPAKPLNFSSANLSLPLKQEKSKESLNSSALNAQLEAILRRYAKEIEDAIVTHLKQHNG